MKKYLPLIVILLLSVFANSQGVQKIRLIGSKADEYFNKVIRTSDGGALFVGEQTVKHGSDSALRDMWLVKMNSAGAIEWQKAYGGSGDDEANSAIQTPDGSFLIVGSTSSTDGAVVGYHGIKPNDVFPEDDDKYDSWIIKIDDAGNLQWSKAFGGTRYDKAFDIVSGDDNTYMIAGTTESIDGDPQGKRKIDYPYPGDSTKAPDIWLFKMDVNGNILWQQCYGGTWYDDVSSLIAAGNGSFIVTGSTNSIDRDVVGSHTYSLDAWIFKIDSSGNIKWEKPLGGSNTDQAFKIVRYKDHYLIAASTTSNDGDVTGYHGTAPGKGDAADIWLLEMDDQGNLLHQKAIGTTADEVGFDLQVAANNDVIIGGYSNQSGLILEKDEADNIVYERIIPSSEIRSISPWAGKSLLMAGLASGSIDSAAHFYGGDYDGLTALFGDVNLIKGKVFLDQNGDGQHNQNEPYMNNVQVTSRKDQTAISSFTTNGAFSNDADSGTYVTTINFANPNYNIQPATHNSVFTGYLAVDSFDFAIVPLSQKGDLSVSAVVLTPVRLGATVSYKLTMINKGTTVFDTAYLKLSADHRLAYNASTVTPATVAGDTVIWKRPAFKPFDTLSVIVTFNVSRPPGANINDVLFLTAAALPVVGDAIKQDNQDTVYSRITGSHDPNDKVENHNGILTPEQAARTAPLTYTIRFQNTGNDTAFNVVVRDTLENRLDWNTLEMFGSSHSYHLSLTSGNILSWEFNNINLVDSGRNEPGSHGYISYRIKPKPGLSVGDTIHNSASIYFDYNLPVKTNTQNTVVRAEAFASPVITGLQSTYCGNAGVQKLKINNLPAGASGVTATAKLDNNSIAISADSTISFDPGTMQPGTHTLQITYSNSVDSKLSSSNFTVTAAVQPDVDISTNISIITHLTDVVILTATNKTGGGTAPLYAFALDRDFAHLLQPESSSNTFSLNPTALAIGDNKVYVRMKTSETCYRALTNIDSITIRRDQSTGLTDPDNPSHVINIYPNPFQEKLVVDGLNSSKSYTITVMNMQGQTLYSRKLANTTAATLTRLPVSTGVYWLHIYDNRKKREIGVIRLLKP